MYRLLYFFLAALVISGPSLRADEATPLLPPLTIEGSVQASDGTPLHGARVDIRNGASSDNVIADTLTDVDGKFAFFALEPPAGQYLVHASAVGHESDEKLFTLKAAGASDLNFTLTLKPAPPERGPSSGYTVVRILYATDRQKIETAGSTQYFGAPSTDGSLSYGSCDVSIPAVHKFAEMEQPSIWKLEYHADPEKHMVLQKVSPEPKPEFFHDVSGMVAKSPDKEAFVFVHGYNVSFEDAAIRTAQLTYDFGFKGAPILYSWPSKASLLGYVADQQSIVDTVPHLKQFLEDVAVKSGATTVHLIAHSMGNRAMLNAVSQLATDKTFRNYGKFNSLVLAAPDVDRDVFIQQVSQIRKPGSMITLYVSQHDQALEASYLLFHSQLRAGEGGTHAIVMDGVDTVDVSKLSMDALGHSYFGDNRTVVEDLLKFLKGQLAPRPGLSKVPMGSLAYWLMLPSN